MIWQGTDRLSRGDRNAGLMAGRPMSTFLPLHLSAEQRSGKLFEWCNEWAGSDLLGDSDIHFLTPEEWYEPMIRGHIYV